MNLKSGWGGCFVIWLTVLRSSHLGKDAERLRLQIGRTATPVFGFIFRLVLSFKHSLIHRRGTVYVRIFNGKATAIQKVKHCETGHGSFHPNLSLVLQLLIQSNSNPKHSFENTTFFLKKMHRSILCELRMLWLILPLKWPVIIQICIFKTVWKCLEMSVYDSSANAATSLQSLE